MTDLVLLYPGAGSSADHPSLVAIEHALASVPCRRADFAYRTQGRRAPDRAPKLLAEMRATVEDLGDARVVIGGRSMGGRIASMLAAGADGSAPPASIAAVVLIAYPLHPPGRPERLRVEHFGDIAVPVLFVSGTRDPFGTPEELRAWTPTITGSVTHEWIDGGRHDLKGADHTVAELVCSFVSTVLS